MNLETTMIWGIALAVCIGVGVLIWKRLRAPSRRRLHSASANVRIWPKSGRVQPWKPRR